MRTTDLTLLAAALILLTGCASLPPEPPPGAKVQHCLPCRHHRDFECLEVTPASDTPRAEWCGRTYCFCSDRCRAEFIRKPTRFVPRPK